MRPLLAFFVFYLNAAAFTKYRRDGIDGGASG